MMIKVSIGMPVYNGSAHIGKALDSLLAQSFKDFELIISDNASTDDTRSICQEYARKDSRVQYIRQKKNLGPIRNFDFVLNQSKGKYFMWAAHDDKWAPEYIEKMLSVFETSDASVVAVASEAQYTIEGKKQKLFAEGEAFRKFCGQSVYTRACHMLKYNYGNLFYSLYKRDVLFSDGCSHFSRLRAKSLNEVPLFLQVVAHGNWRVIPEFLFYKQTIKVTYIQAVWEMQGGFLPFGSLRSYAGLFIYSLKYHLFTAVDIYRAISLLRQNRISRLKLYAKATARLTSHFAVLVMHYKLPGVRDGR